MPILVEDTAIDYNNVSIITEAYYGKHKELKNAEKLLEPIITSVHYEYEYRHKNVPDGPLNGKDVNASKEARLIEQCFKKALGVGEVNITWYGARISSDFIYKDSNGDIGIDLDNVVQNPNAYNIPSAIAKIKNAFGKNKMSDMVIHIFVDKGLIYRYNMTPGEVMAIMLHEAGHAVNMSVFSLLMVTLPSPKSLFNAGKQGEKALIEAIVGYVITPLIREIFPYVQRECDRFIDRFLHKTSAAKVLTAYAQFIQNKIRLFYKVTDIIDLIQGNANLVNPETLILNLVEPRHIFGYADEKYADSFATAHGYGVELSSVMRKFNYGENNSNIRKVPALNVLYDLYQCTFGVFRRMTSFDEHPQDAVRIYSQLKKLRRELKDPNLPPGLAKEVESQIVELEKMCAEMSSVRENVKNGMIVSAVYNKIIMNVFNGNVDPRELFEAIWRHEE